MSIQSQIESLENQLSLLRIKQRMGYEALEGNCDEYYIDTYHTVLKNTEGNLAGIIVNPKIVKAYLEASE